MTPRRVTVQTVTPAQRITANSAPTTQRMTAQRVATVAVSRPLRKI